MGSIPITCSKNKTTEKSVVFLFLQNSWLCHRFWSKDTCARLTTASASSALLVITCLLKQHKTDVPVVFCFFKTRGSATVFGARIPARASQMQALPRLCLLSPACSNYIERKNPSFFCFFKTRGSATVFGARIPARASQMQALPRLCLLSPACFNYIKRISPSFFCFFKI